MRAAGVAIVAIMIATLAHGETASPADWIGTARSVPSPSLLPSMPSEQWCKTVDAALLNPRIDKSQIEEYIATGQAHKCPHQMLFPPRKTSRATVSPQQWCGEAFKALGNPYVNEWLKATILEKARNHGCLR